MLNRAHIKLGRRGRRGMTLVEAMMSVGVLSLGFLGIVGLLTNVSVANRKSEFHSFSLDVMSELQSQIQDAPCDLNPSSNALDSGLAFGWHTSPAAQSSITYVGSIYANSSNIGPAPQVTVPVFVGYYVRGFGDPDPSVQGNCGPGNPCTRPDVYRVTIMICDATDTKHPCASYIPPATSTDEISPGSWIRSFTITKTCTIRLDDTGRGEFYP